jgi:hypothetical protein
LLEALLRNPLADPSILGMSGGASQGPEFWLLRRTARASRSQTSACGDAARRAALARSGRGVMMALHEPTWAARFCGHALLLYDRGRSRLGPIAEVSTQEDLEALYRCRLEPIGSGTTPFFLPASS